MQQISKITFFRYTGLDSLITAKSKNFTQKGHQHKSPINHIFSEILEIIYMTRSEAVIASK